MTRGHSARNNCDGKQTDAGSHPITIRYRGAQAASPLALVVSDIDHTLRHLKRWARPQRRAAPLAAWPARAWVTREPAGTVLIMGPWNYPIQLTLSPLVGALAGGNTACIKPSELAPHAARVLAQVLGAAFEPDVVLTVEGDASVAEALLRERFDHVFVWDRR